MISHHIISYPALFYHIILYHILLYFISIFYIILFYFILIPSTGVDRDSKEVFRWGEQQHSSPRPCGWYGYFIRFIQHPCHQVKNTSHSNNFYYFIQQFNVSLFWYLFYQFFYNDWTFECICSLMFEFFNTIQSMTQNTKFYNFHLR